MTSEKSTRVDRALERMTLGEANLRRMAAPIE